MITSQELVEDIKRLQGIISDAEDKIVDTLVSWFHFNYEDPVEIQPSNFWLLTPCEAREELQDNFPELSESIIGSAVAMIEEDGTTQWCSRKDLEDINK